MTVSNLPRLLSIVALVLVVGAPNALAQGSGRISGVVLNDETSEPIVGATMRVELPDSTRDPVEVTTDDSGRFSVFGFVSGQWMTTITMEGFSPESSPVTVTQGTNNPVTYYMVRVRGGLELKRFS